MRTGVQGEPGAITEGRPGWLGGWRPGFWGGFGPSSEGGETGVDFGGGRGADLGWISGRVMRAGKGGFWGGWDARACMGLWAGLINSLGGFRSDNLTKRLPNLSGSSDTFCIIAP